LIHIPQWPIEIFSICFSLGELNQIVVTSFFPKKAKINWEFFESDFGAGRGL
jgi:hypothetical protein